ITSVDNCIVKPSAEYDPRYVVHQLSTPAYLGYIEVIARGGTRDRISRSMLGDIEIVSPPLEEQRAIAAFLDRKTAEIDGVIVAKERMVGLLQEKRQALISQAVTRGLNPSVSMKDSGIPWLGQVPKHWMVRKLATFASVGNGSTPLRDNLSYWDSGD